MYKITRGEEVTIGRAYVLTLNGKTLVFSGNVDRMTSKRKAEIHRIAVETINGKPVADTVTEADLSAYFDRTPYCRRDNVSYHLTLCTAPNGDVTETLDYTDKMGGGSWNTLTTSLHHVA